MVVELPLSIQTDFYQPQCSKKHHNFCSLQYEWLVYADLTKFSSHINYTVGSMIKLFTFNSNTVMRFVFLLLWILSAKQSLAQSDHLQTLLFSETNFSLSSQIVGLKQGFLQNLDTSALGINRNGFSSLYKIWQQREESAKRSALVWQPELALVSSDGLFGVTDGPYFTQNGQDTVLKHTGYFFSVWNRASTKEPFKIVFDSGIPSKNVIVSTEYASTDAKKTQLKNEAIKSSPSASFIEATKKKSLTSFLQKYLMEDGELLVSEHGRINKINLNTVGWFQKKWLLSKTGDRLLKSGYLEFGKIDEVEGPEASAMKGYFLHVWISTKQGWQLCAAFYKLD